MTYDRRTGKPIASLVSKIAPEVVMSEERVIGVVTTEARIDPENGQETQGRISYENRWEQKNLEIIRTRGEQCAFWG